MSILSGGLGGLTMDELAYGAKQLEARNKQVGGVHYQKPVQPWDAMEAWMSREQFIGYLRGNAIKYLARCDDKGGFEDLQKAQHYIAKLIEVSSR